MGHAFQSGFPDLKTGRQSHEHPHSQFFRLAQQLHVFFPDNPAVGAVCVNGIESAVFQFLQREIPSQACIYADGEDGVAPGSFQGDHFIKIGKMLRHFVDAFDLQCAGCDQCPVPFVVNQQLEY